MLPISGVLFDIDGTLIDSNDAHARAWEDVFKENGLSVPYPEIRRRIGMGGDHLLPEVASISKESPQGKKMDERRGELFRSNYLPKLKAFPKSRELLETLKAKDYQITVATSASSKDLKQLLKQADLDGLFDAKTNSSDVESSKPDPDIIQAALKASKLDARRAVMIGDTPYDVEAAKRAGVKTIAVTCGGWTAEALKEAGAWKVYESPSELLQALINGQAFI